MPGQRVCTRLACDDVLMAPGPQSIHELSYTSNTGATVELSQYAGKPLLIVNTATKCGLAPQLRTLEQLHEQYGPLGLTIIGFPCGQFANQEPGNDDQIAHTCQLNFGVTFPLASKVCVNGPSTDPVFRFLKAKSSGLLGSRIKWNFTKFLVSPDGTAVKRFAPQVSPKQIVPLISPWLTEPLSNAEH
ncbi:MAG: glutathione peroxidase [Patulibacter sp.]